MIQRNAKAVWKGGLKDGKGVLTAPSGVLRDTQYSFGTRFENGVGTNPEELIAAAHAGCFSMAFSGELGKAGLTPTSIETTANVTLEKTDAGFRVTKIHLVTSADVPNATQQAIDKAANDAKVGCPISNLLNATITMEAKLTSGARA